VTRVRTDPCMFPRDAPGSKPRVLTHC
jgi:hypothetical protein